MERYRLDNGLAVILVPHELAPVIAMQAWVGVGSADETPRQAGIAHIAQRPLRGRAKPSGKAGARPGARPGTKADARPGAGTRGDIVRETLPSGMRVLIKRDPTVPVVAMRAVWTGGLRWEKPAQNGITHLLARVISRGCQGLSAEALIAKLDDMAGSLSGFSGKNSFGLRAEWLAQSWTQGLELTAQCLLAPRFDEGEIARERRRVLEDIAAREDNPSFLAFQLFTRAMYRRHPYRMDMSGTRDSVAGLDRDALARYYRDHFPMSALTLVIVGDVDPDDALERVRRLFTSVPARERAPRAVPVERFSGRSARSREVYGYLDRNQAQLIMGFPGTTLDADDRFALETLTTILGGQGGRLFVELRERRGLAYRVGAVSVEGIDPGYVAVYLACSPDKIAAARMAIHTELSRLVAEPVSHEELERAKRYLIGTHELSQQRRSAVAAAVAFHEAYGLGYEQYLRYDVAIRAVSAADVQEVAARYLHWGLAVTATVTPPQASPEAERRTRGRKRRVPRSPGRKGSP